MIKLGMRTLKHFNLTQEQRKNLIGKGLTCDKLKDIFIESECNISKFEEELRRLKVRSPKVIMEVVRRLKNEKI